MCKQQIGHWTLDQQLAPLLALEREVQERALRRMKSEGLASDPAIHAQFGGDELAFAMHEYVFYQCFKCKRPYFGGNYRCGPAPGEAEEDEAFLERSRPGLVQTEAKDLVGVIRHCAHPALVPGGPRREGSREPSELRRIP